MHMYIYTLPLDSGIRIPRSISIPLVKVAAHLQLPPVATYSGTVLYNWALKSPTEDATPPVLHNLRSQDLFTGTNDEQEFYLASSRIEIRGVEALELMRATMDEMFVGDEIVLRHITDYLHQLAAVVDDLTRILLNVRKGCDPEFFYHSIRPWFRGEDSNPMGRSFRRARRAPRAGATHRLVWTECRSERTDTCAQRLPRSGQFQRTSRRRRRSSWLLDVTASHADLHVERAVTDKFDMAVAWFVLVIYYLLFDGLKYLTAGIWRKLLRMHTAG